MPVRSATAQHALDALAARLRDIRKDAELTARQVAQAAGWHESKCSRQPRGGTHQPRDRRPPLIRAHSRKSLYPAGASFLA